MIVFKSTQELRGVFEKLIRTINARVEWDGLFVVVDNFLILKGTERSMIFNLNTKRAGTNIIDINVKEEEVLDIGVNTVIINSFNMLLYAFGKWGALKGIRVEKSYEQLNILFKSILKDANIEPDYNEDHYYFYKNGMRLTYEEVVSAARELYQGQGEETDEAVKDSGLWHNITWQLEKTDFPIRKTDYAERQNNRIGNNFYLVDYKCPRCGANLYTAVFPEDMEPVIETSEGQVRLARVSTCPACFVFFAARALRLLSEGEAYIMDFEGDETAYEDYQELLGRNGGRLANGNFNEYVNQSHEEEAAPTESDEEDSETAGYEDAYEPEGEFEAENLDETENFDEIETLYQDDENALKGRTERPNAEGRNGTTTAHMGGRADNGTTDAKAGSDKSAVAHSDISQDKNSRTEKRSKKSKIDESENYISDNADMSKPAAKQQREQPTPKPDMPAEDLTTGNDSGSRDKGVSESGTEVQAADMHEEDIRQMQNKQALSGKLNREIARGYAALKRFREEIRQADITPHAREELLDIVDRAISDSASKEVEALAAELPESLNRKNYETYKKKLEQYKETDISDAESLLRAARQNGERREAEDIVQKARKSTREDLTELGRRIREQKFSREVLEEYEKRLEEAIAKIDRQRLDGACADYMNYTGEELEKLYNDIEQETFLPELKNDALGRIGLRLRRIKTKECEQLKTKLKKEFEENEVSDCEQHFFYPAAEILSGNADRELVEHIEYAKGSYASEAGPFEYPLFMADTTRSGTGKAGMLLTPDGLYFGNFITCGSAKVEKISSVEAATGLIGKGVVVRMTDGSRFKVPYAVDNRELKGYAKALNDFIMYLKEKPFSRKDKYLIRERHDTICCFRCGYVYKNMPECPKCGYKQNR